VHELLRQYGREQLARVARVEQQVCQQHSAYYLEQLARLGADLKSTRQTIALNSIDLEHENYRAAWNWVAEQGDIAQLDQALEPLCLYYELRLRYPEGESACRAALETLPQDHSSVAGGLLRVRLLIWQSRFNWLSGNLDQADSQHSACQSLLEQPGLASADTRYEQALLEFDLGETITKRDVVSGGRHYQLSLELFQELEQPWWALMSLIKLIDCEIRYGDYEAAKVGLEQCLVDLFTHGDHGSQARMLKNKGFLHVYQGELDQAMQSMQQAAELYRSTGDRFNIAISLNIMGLMLGWHGRYQESIDPLVKSLLIYQELGCCFNAASTNMSVGMMHTLLGHYQAAQEWLCKGLSQAQAFDFRWAAATSLLALGWVALSQSDYCKAGELLQESVDEYRQVKYRNELGWALAALGHSKLAQGLTEEGLVLIRESLQIGKENGATHTISLALGPYALWIGRQGTPIRAVELYTLACQHPAMANSPWFAEVYGYPVAALAEHLSAEEVSTARARGRSLDLLQTAAELLDELSKEVDNADHLDDLP